MTWLFLQRCEYDKLFAIIPSTVLYQRDKAVINYVHVHTAAAMANARQSGAIEVLFFLVDRRE